MKTTFMQLWFSEKQILRQVVSMGGCAHENVDLHV